MYASFPGSGWHIGGFSNHLGLGDCCVILERFGAWRDDRERSRVGEAAALLADYRLQKTSFYHFDNEQRNNRTLTSARGVFRLAQAFADHADAGRWRDWAIRQFRINLNARSTRMPRATSRTGSTRFSTSSSTSTAGSNSTSARTIAPTSNTSAI